MQQRIETCLAGLVVVGNVHGVAGLIERLMSLHQRGEKGGIYEVVKMLLMVLS